MTISYQLRIYDGSTFKGVITDMLALDYTRRVNDVGMCRFTISENNAYAGEIQKNRSVEVWRQTAEGAPFYKEETYIVRGEKYTYNGKTNDLLITAVSGNWLLSTRVVAWAAGTANRSTFDSQKAETIAKNLVKYNFGSLATVANGRLVAGDTSNTVQADAAGGNTLDLNCAYDNLLKTLYDVAMQGGGDFELVWTGSVWDFRWYAGQLGADRTSALVFSLARGNLLNPSYTLDWLNEKTLAVVGGQGEGAARNVRTRTGADWSTSNQIEAYVDARDVEAGVVNENDLIDKRGDVTLSDARARGALEFEIAQSRNSLYGVDYFLGDLGTVIYADANATVQICEVSVVFSAGRDEVVSIGVRNV